MSWFISLGRLVVVVVVERNAIFVLINKHLVVYGACFYVCLTRVAVKSLRRIDHESRSAFDIQYNIYEELAIRIKP